MSVLLRRALGSHNLQVDWYHWQSALMMWAEVPRIIFLVHFDFSTERYSYYRHLGHVCVLYVIGTELWHDCCVLQIWQTLAMPSCCRQTRHTSRASLTQNDWSCSSCWMKKKKRSDWRIYFMMSHYGIDEQLSLLSYLAYSVVADLNFGWNVCIYIHTYTRLMALCPGLPGWADSRKVKPSGFYWSKRQWVAWHQLGRMQVCTSLQTDKHASTPPLSFFTGRMPFLPANRQRQSTEGTVD